MTLTYPRDFLIGSMYECTFLLDQGVTAARHDRGTRATHTRTFEPVWTAKFNISNMHREKRREWNAWENSLMGGLNRFLVWDRDSPELGAYPEGPPTFGTVSISAFVDRSKVTLSGLPANYKATVGDPIGFVKDDRYGYFRIMESVQANASGVATIQVQPFVPLIFDLTSVVTMYRPLIEMTMRHETYSSTAQASPTAISFEAVQYL